MGANGKRTDRTCTRHPGGRSQLSKSDTGALGPNDPTRTNALTRHDTARPRERTHMGANGKRAARPCTRHLGGHNLANLTRVPSCQTTRPDPNGRPRPARPLERSPSCRTTKRHDTNGRPHPARPHDRTPSPGATRHRRPNGRTWEQTANGPPERAQGTQAVTT